MVNISEDIKNIIYKMTSEAVFENSENGFEQTFYKFLSDARAYIGKIGNTKNKEEKYGILKSKILNIFDKIKNCKLIFGISTENFENQLNELIFSTELNKVKSVSDVEIEDEKLINHYSGLTKILSFEFDEDIEDEYGFWCFLKIGRILTEMYENSENNIINSDLALNNIKSMLKFVFRNSDGETAELLYNYHSILENENLIYLILKKQGREPVSFAFKTNGEDISTLHILRDSLCKEENGKKSYLFSGIYLFSCDDKTDKKEYNNTLKNKLGKISFSPVNTADAANLIRKIGFYEPAVSECVCTSEVSERLKRYEIERRNMLVVTVKSKEQLEINLKHNFYYMPASKIINVNCDYEYIAVYQSATFFGGCSGILYFGEIEDIRAVRRCEILEIPKDSNENYLRFSVKWKTKDEKINPDVAVKSFADTSYELFKNAKNVSELYIRSYEEYKTYIFLKNICKNVKIFGNENGIYEIKADGLKVEFNRMGFSVYDGDKYVFALSRPSFRKNLKSVFKKIEELIEKEKEEKN